MNLLRLALKNIVQDAGRTVFLLLSLAFCFAVILILTGLSSGAMRNVNDGATLYYGGDLLVLGHQKRPYYTPMVRDHEGILSALKDSGIDHVRVARRTNYFENGALFFGGESIRQKKVAGIDWKAESGVFASMDFVSGSAGNMDGSDGILLSRAAADKLHVRVGDDILLAVTTVTGQRNTADLVVRGVFADSSIFGYYTSYMDLERLNRLIGFQEGEYTTLGIRLSDGSSAARWAPLLHAKLAEKVPTFPYVATQPELWSRLAGDWTGVTYAVLTLDGYLSDVKTLIAALNVGTVFLLFLMFGFIVIGISNTFRVIVYRRIREIGTLRALGWRSGKVRALFMAESVLLSVAGIALGSLLGFLALSAVSWFPVPRIPGIEIFLSGGRMGYRIGLQSVAVDVLAVLGSALLGVLGPARTAGRMKPAQAMRVESC